MRLSAVAFCMILTTIFLSGCGQESHVAAIDQRGGNFYGKNGVTTLGSAPVMRSLGFFSNATEQKAETVSVASRDLPAPSAQPTQSAKSWQWPVNGPVTETFGQKSAGIVNEGIVISAPEGTPIKAAQAGEVAFVGRDTKTYGNIAIVRHPSGEMTSYAHAKEIIVAKGAQVGAGAILGYVGQTGSAKLPQLHFALRQGGTSVDPMIKLPHQVASN
jgi:murein DD-endopeptidase MepM/ murein hydrolase activator NlpD